MTREEAIEELKILKEGYWDDDGYGHETEQYDNTMLALDMAIKALEQEQDMTIAYLMGKYEDKESCDIQTLTERVVTRVTEDVDNFIFTTITPWCEAQEQRKISKHDLKEALTQYYGKKSDRYENIAEDLIEDEDSIFHIEPCERGKSE